MNEIPTTIKNKNLVEKRREQLVLAAIKLFSVNGYHKTTLKEIAEEAGLRYGNVYDYIGCKEDIFSLIHEYAAGSAMKALQLSIKNVSDPLEKLQRIIRSEFDLMSQMADAIMLIYQESHILSRPNLHRLLSKEREHLSVIEQAIKESIQNDYLKRCNIRLVANLIKILIDSWVIKRWDMRRHVNRTEAETTILDILFHGLLSHPEIKKNSDIHRNGKRLSGQTVFVANAHTPIGISLCQDLLSHGCRLAVYGDTEEFRRQSPNTLDKISNQLKFYSKIDETPRSASLFAKIEREMGHFDIYIHDLGIGTLELPQGKSKDGLGLVENLASAEAFSEYFTMEDIKTSLKRIVYIAPWGWDQFQDSIRFESVRAGVSGLTKILANRLASHGINVNCVVPGFVKYHRPSNLEKQFGGRVQMEIPRGIMGEICDVVEAIVFFLSDSARYITGEVIKVCG